MLYVHCTWFKYFKVNILLEMACFSLLKNPLGTTMVKPTSFGTEVWFIIL